MGQGSARVRAAGGRGSAVKRGRKKAAPPPPPTAGNGVTSVKVPFALEATPVKGEVPERVIDELVHAKVTAKDYAKAFADACKAMGKKYGVKEGALKKYVGARAADKVAAVSAETDDLVRLLG